VPEIHLSGCGVNQDFAGNVLASTSSGWLLQIFKVYLRLALRGPLEQRIEPLGPFFVAKIET